MYKDKKIAIIVAHPDDEVYGMGGTIARLCDNNNEVNILYVTNGMTSCGFSRYDVIYKVKKILNFNDFELLHLSDQKLDSLNQMEINDLISRYIYKINPDIVYTHAIEDLNIDHRIIHNSTMVSCRPQRGCSVKELYTFCNSSWDFNEFGSFNSNTFIDIDKYIYKKTEAMKVYESEIKKYPHPMSLTNISNRHIEIGSKFCLYAVEEFKQIFRIF